MLTLNKAESTSEILAEDCVTTAGFSQVDSQRIQEFSREEIPVAGSHNLPAQLKKTVMDAPSWEGVWVHESKKIWPFNDFTYK